MWKIKSLSKKSLAAKNYAVEFEDDNGGIIRATNFVIKKGKVKNKLQDRLNAIDAVLGKIGEKEIGI